MNFPARQNIAARASWAAFTTATGRRAGVPARVCAAMVRAPAMLMAAFLLYACAAFPPFAEESAAVDPYAAFKESRPLSILVMPPINQSFDLEAQNAILATAAKPLAEAGYYVIPAALSNETFRQNGIPAAEEAHALPPARLREIFGADAALYITITHFGVQYAVLDSVITASASAKLVDLQSGRELWAGEGSTTHGGHSGVSAGIGGGEQLLGMVIGAVIQQAINVAAYAPYDLGRQTNISLLSGGKRGGILYGPYHPKYGTD